MRKVGTFTLSSREEGAEYMSPGANREKGAR